MNTLAAVKATLAVVAGGLAIAVLMWLVANYQQEVLATAIWSPVVLIAAFAWLELYRSFGGGK